MTTIAKPAIDSDSNSNSKDCLLKSWLVEILVSELAHLEEHSNLGLHNFDWP